LFDSFENHYHSRFPMTFKHDEFPPLTHQAECVLMNSLKGIDVSSPYWDRRFAAAVIREAITQTGVWNLSFRGQSSDVLFASELRAIADNLHALPPPPPTREEMEDALRRLTQLADYQPGSKADVWAQTIQRGLAHYCSPTP
jgi:hypothetical protein